MTSSEMVEAYGPSSLLTPFGSTDFAADFLVAPSTSRSASNSAESTTKRHAACDECRTRKLKCSGESAGCARCLKHKIQCHYSTQKQMGRPRKRQRMDDDHGREKISLLVDAEASQRPSLDPPPEQVVVDEAQIETPIDPSLAAIDRDRTTFTNVCNGPIAQSIRDLGGPRVRQQQEAFWNKSQSLNGDQPPAVDGMAAPYPLDITSWPDFSTLQSLPVPMQDSLSSASTYPISSRPQSTDEASHYDLDANPAALSALPSVPSCPCLPNLYLTLSTLSTLSSFPVTAHTTETLLAAHRTAYSVIYCPVCPKKTQSGSQNLMLGCTLLSVVADHWHRVQGCSAEEMKSGFGRSISCSAAEDGLFMTTKQGQAWRRFSRQLVRSYVFGDVSIPTPESFASEKAASFQPRRVSDERSPSMQTADEYVSATNSEMVPEQYTLSFLVKALDRRQRQWHNIVEPTDEFPDRCAEGMGSRLQRTFSHSHHGHNHGGGLSTGGVNSTSNIKDASIGEISRGEGMKGDNALQDSDDKLLCLMIVKRVHDLVRSLDDGQGI